MTSVVLALLLQAAAPMIDEAPVPLGAVQVREGQSLTLHLEPFGITVAKAGDGIGVVASEPHGIDCGPDCAELWKAGTVVILTATPASGSRFVGWVGACAGAGECKIAVSQAELVTATFARAQEVEVEGLIGAQVGLAGGADNTYEPFARLRVEVPITSALNAPALLVNVDLGGLPGEAVNIEEPQSWKTLEVGIAGRWYPFESVNVALWGEIGFATRRAGEFVPRKSAPRWAYGGVILDRFKVGSLALGLGTDQRIDGEYIPAATIKGWVRLWQAMKGALKGVVISFVGEAVLALRFADYGAPDLPLSDSLRAGLATGWGTRK